MSSNAKFNKFYFLQNINMSCWEGHLLEDDTFFTGIKTWQYITEIINFSKWFQFSDILDLNITNATCLYCSWLNTFITTYQKKRVMKIMKIWGKNILQISKTIKYNELIHDIWYLLIYLLKTSLASNLRLWWCFKHQSQAIKAMNTQSFWMTTNNWRRLFYFIHEIKLLET